jgi:hypothetical protein
VTPLFVQLLELGGDEIGFVVFILAQKKFRLFALPILGPERFVLALEIPGDQGRGDLEDGFRGAVVLFELHDLGVGIVFFEFENVFDVGAAPGVDGLIGIADDADVAVAKGKRVGEEILRVVGVLIFVDENVLESLLKLGEHVGMIAQRQDRAKEQVVEIQRVVLLQEILIFLVHAGDDAGVKIPGGLGVGLSRDQLILGVADGRMNGPGGEIRAGDF